MSTISYTRFTDRARKVMQLANQEAQRLNHDTVRPAHILFGLVKDAHGIAGGVLGYLGVSLKTVRDVLEKTGVGGETVTVGRLPLTDEAENLIQTAVSVADEWRHAYVGTEHMLMALVREPDGVSLCAVGLTPEVVDKDLRMVLLDVIPAAEPAA